MIIDETELQKAEMESEIRTLLDIEDEKSQTLTTLETQLRNSEENERRLMEKLTVLSENFSELENHIAVMKQKLITA
jgi:predicted  nucleic acid-binding Zn-ribbon protein